MLKKNLMTLGSDEALDHLRHNDPLLGEAIARLGKIKVDTHPDPFAVLIRNIAGQQISGKAAETVWNRLNVACHPMDAATIHTTNVATIQSCGMSLRKAGYIHGLADRVISGALDLERLKILSDEEAIRELTACAGIGIWTAEMLLIFSYRRPDIVSWSDLGIRRGMMYLYGLETLSKTQFQSYRKRYAPYGTMASFYLWAITNEHSTRKKNLSAN
jgi:3-methyladenine DNA glycosylase/8-oxoguanine DNA glycosylase